MNNTLSIYKEVNNKNYALKNDYACKLFALSEDACKIGDKLNKPIIIHRGFKAGEGKLHSLNTADMIEIKAPGCHLAKEDIASSLKELNLNHTVVIKKNLVALCTGDPDIYYDNNKEIIQL